MTDATAGVVLPDGVRYTLDEIHEMAEKAAASGRSFGLSTEEVFEVLKSGQDLAHFVAYKNVKTASDFEEARRRLAEWEESERRRKAAEAGWPV